MRLSINVDHVATVRQARRAPYPDPVEAAVLAEGAGAHGITVHLREDRRHIQDDDVIRLRAVVKGKLNLEMAATEAMVRLARQFMPDQVTLVPERPDEITTEGGLDLAVHQSRIQRVTSTLAESGIVVSLFLDPEERLLESVRGMRDVDGFEINTDAYTRAEGEPASREAAKIGRAAELGRREGLRVYAGHGLTVNNVGQVAAVPQIEELNIGHSIVSRALLIGMEAAVGEMLAALAESGR